MDPIDVFVDLSTCDITGAELHHLAQEWAIPDNLGVIARRLRIVVAPGTLPAPPPLPPGWVVVESTSLVTPLRATLEAAGQDDVQLLLLTGPVHVGSEAIGVLRQCLARDPMVGFAVPRISCTRRCCFARLARHGVGATEWLPRRVLAELPDSEFLVEVAAPCVLVGSQVVGNFAVSGRLKSGAAAMLQYMASARRAGFRTLMCNRAVVSVEGLTCEAESVEPVPAPPGAELSALHAAVPELERSWLEFRAGSWERFERLCTRRAGAFDTARRPSLLLDVRNVGPLYNGTTQAVLGIAKALKELASMWDVSLLANPRGATFHDLKHVFAGRPVYTEVPDRVYTCSLRPSQPWHISEMIDLHNVSLFNAYLFLDTIAWDIAYVGPPHLEGTWQFLADHADALLFDSGFTRQRFLERFPAAAATPNVVTHFSFDPKEYARHDVSKSASDGDFILVVGNNLDHKDVPSTVEALASAFPFRPIAALGGANVLSRFVTAQHSGELPETDIHGLYATARCVVFPSFYEGFGFPIITALAYGRTVLVRRSELVEELAGRCVARGRLIVFNRREELVDLIGRLVHGEAVPELPLGGGLASGKPRRWRDVAQDVLGFLEPLVAHSTTSRWIARERAVSQLLAYRT